jgi:hypothetical protein
VVGHHGGSVRVDRHKGPCQRTRHSRQVDEPGVAIVAEVEGSEVNKVEDQDDLRPHSVPVNEEQHPNEVEQVVDDEMAPNSTRRIDAFDRRREEVGNIAELEDEEGEPGETC